jgi:hypothetical protein
VASTGSGVRWILLALLGLVLVFRAGAVLNLEIDPDESQHLHAAWQVAQGRVPYRDFWEHHLPLFYPLLAPVVRLVGETPAVYTVARTLVSVAALAALVLTARLGGRLPRGTGLLAALLLGLVPQYLETTTEARPDVPALVAWLGSLLAVVRWREGGGSGCLWMAGALQGLGLTLSLKAVYGFPGLALAVLGGRRRRPPDGGGLAALAPLALGTALPLAGVVAWLAAAGGADALRGLLAQGVGANLGFVDFTKTWPLPGVGLPLGGLAAAGLVLTLRAEGLRGALRHPLHGTLLPALATVATLLALPWTPAVYEQAWLPVLPIASLYGAVSGQALLAWAGGQPGAARRAVVALAAVAALGVPAAGSAWEALRDRGEAQRWAMRRLLAETCPDEPVLDGTALAVFRPAAYRYGVLMNGVREWIAQGRIPEEQIEEDLRAARARVAYADSRVRSLIGPVATFLRRHYVPVPGTGHLLVAGAVVPASGEPAGGRAYVDLLLGGPYRYLADPGIEAALDRVPLRRGRIDLTAGRHELTWTGPAGTIRLEAVGCRDRDQAFHS